MSAGRVGSWAVATVVAGVATLGAAGCGGSDQADGANGGEVQRASCPRQEPNATVDLIEGFVPPGESPEDLAESGGGTDVMVEVYVEVANDTSEAVLVRDVRLRMPGAPELEGVSLDRAVPEGGEVVPVGETGTFYGSDVVLFQEGNPSAEHLRVVWEWADASLAHCDPFALTPAAAGDVASSTTTTAPPGAEPLAVGETAVIPFAPGQELRLTVTDVRYGSDCQSADASRRTWMFVTMRLEVSPGSEAKTVSEHYWTVPGANTASLSSQCTGVGEITAGPGQSVEGVLAFRSSGAETISYSDDSGHTAVWATPGG